MPDQRIKLDKKKEFERKLDQLRLQWDLGTTEVNRTSNNATDKDVAEVEEWGAGVPSISSIRRQRSVSADCLGDKKKTDLESVKQDNNQMWVDNQILLFAVKAELKRARGEANQLKRELREYKVGWKHYKNEALEAKDTARISQSELKVLQERVNEYKADLTEATDNLCASGIREEMNKEQIKFLVDKNKMLILMCAEKNSNVESRKNKKRKGKKKK